MDEAILRSFYRQLVDINRETFEGKEFDIAYHALSAACACAAALNDPQCLEQIQKIAEDDLACIDSHHPEYEHSTKSAFKRKMPGIFHTLAMEANGENSSDEIQGVHRQTLAGLLQPKASDHSFLKSSPE